VPQREQRETQQPSTPIYNMVGEKVALGPGERDEEIALWHASDNDFGVTMFAGDPLWPRARAVTEAEYDERAKQKDNHFAGFMIYEKATATPIGGLGLRDIDWARGIATLGIAITRKEYWGKGYGTEAIFLLLDWAFTTQGLHNVMLETFAYNERAIASYRKVGFKEIGRRRESQRLGNRRYDEVYMDILASEFHSPYKPVIELP
jgi:RimJ/RimL family protein N-acetyltransferase